MGQQLIQPGGGLGIPQQHDTGHGGTNIFYAPVGPFACIYNGVRGIRISSGRLWTNSNGTNFNFAGKEFAFGGGVLNIVLNCQIAGGTVVSATLEPGPAQPQYRSWSSEERSAETQTSLTALIAVISNYRIAGESSNISRGSNIVRIFQAVNHDLMVYEACDGLILLPAPFSMP